MKYLSVCSGIEAATVAWHPLGWTPVGFSEIEKFPSKVLAHHFPNVPNFGDLTRYESWPIAPGSADLLVGGTPCQSFSVAGKRGGLADPRGRLMFSYLGIAERLRLRWIVWENVPGVLSSSGGRDFGSFLGALGQLGYGWAYRIVDAQWCRVDGYTRAVPQRRRRVFVVGYLGDAERAASVLFESQSVRRHIEKGVTMRSGDSNAVAGSVTTKESALDFESSTIIVHATQDPIVSITRCHALGRSSSSAVLTSEDQFARRLTPRECERLQGFPDDWTDIKPGGKPTPDGPRYKAIGNSMAVNCMRWIGTRIQALEMFNAGVKAMKETI